MRSLMTSPSRAGWGWKFGDLADVVLVQGLPEARLELRQVIRLKLNDHGAILCVPTYARLRYTSSPAAFLPARLTRLASSSGRVSLAVGPGTRGAEIEATLCVQGHLESGDVWNRLSPCGRSTPQAPVTPSLHREIPNRAAVLWRCP